MKILIVEDDLKIAQNIKKGLEFSGYFVDLAHDGEEGLAMAVANSYEVIILDRMLPQLSGVEVCQNLREQKIHTPVLMLTAKTMINDRVVGLDAGADDYLGKPFAFAELLARIKALTRRPPKIQASKLEIDNLVLNPVTKQVTRDGQNIDLSKKEYALLYFLMNHSKQVFTADQLVEKVWPYEDDVLANTAQVYMGYLRKKIDQPFKQFPQLIKTKRGFGYYLAPANEQKK